MSAESQLQPLIDLTVRRLSEFLKDVLLTLKAEERYYLKIICKWGCDGSKQYQFKQKFENDGDSDSNIFQSCFVPLRLVCGKENEKILWENPTPSSPRYCRPIRFRFVKESTDVIEEEINHINNSVKSLVETRVDINGKLFLVTHLFIMTMVDGKVCNAATGTTSTSQCYICGATSKEFNQLDYKRKTNPKAIEFGLSVLHARIRLFESILHLSYELQVKNTDKEKQIQKKKSKKSEND